MTVELSVQVTPALVRRFEDAGFAVRNVGTMTLEGYATRAALRALAADVTVSSVRPIVRPLAAIDPGPGPALLGAEPWTAAGLSGSGVRVGIVDVGFGGLMDRLGSSLPATVVARCFTDLGIVSSSPADCGPASDMHGTAVAETLAAMAPGVSLYIANPATPLEVLQSVKWMTSRGVRVINSSVGWFLEGPGDGTSPYPDSLYAAVDAAVAAGALWVNAAGNEAGDAWTGPWNDPDGNGLLNWSGSEERNRLTLDVGDKIIANLRWTSPASDYALTLSLDGRPVVVNDDRQAVTRDPAEVIEYTAQAAGTYDLEVRQVAGPPDPRLRLLVADDIGTGLEYSVPSGSLPSPADSRNAGEVTVGAVRWSSPSTIEEYSSQGPTTDGRVKPDLVALDCLPTTVYAPFCGTSQAAPFVAGAAALALETNPALTPAALASWLRAHATPLGVPTPDSVFGAGLLALGPSPVEPPAAARFSAPPASGIAGLALAGQPAVSIVGATGSAVSVGRGSLLPVTISIASNPTGAQLTCAGGTTRTAVAGTAFFSGCSIDQPGTYTLRADAPGLAAVGQLAAGMSPPFTVLPAGSSLPLTIAAREQALAYGAAAALSVAFAMPAGASQPVDLQRSIDGATWTTIASGATDTAGLAAFAVTPTVSARYRASTAAAAASMVEVSAPVAVAVAARLSLASSIGSGRVLPRGTRVTLSGSVVPHGGAIARARMRVAIYERVGTSWRLSRTLYANADPSGRASLVVSMSTPGSWWIRARAEPTPTNAASTWATGVRYLVY